MRQTDYTDGIAVADDLAGDAPVSQRDPANAALLAQYARCCADWRHHDAIVWEMPLATVTANAIIVWAAFAGGHRWLLVIAWAGSAAAAACMVLGLRKQMKYAHQVLARIREIETQLDLPAVTRPVGRPGLVSACMTWLLRGLVIVDLVLAVIFLLRPSLLL